MYKAYNNLIFELISESDIPQAVKSLLSNEAHGHCSQLTPTWAWYKCVQ